MEISSTGLQTSAVAGVSPQMIAQPQEQTARNLRNERERDDATRPNDQVTLSGASQEIAARESGRVAPKAEVVASGDKTQGTDRVDQARQQRVDAQRDGPPVPSSVARALENYTQAAALSS